MGILIVLLLLAYVPSHLNVFDGMKDSVQNSFNQSTGYKMIVNGDLRLDLLPLPQITLNQVSVIDDENYIYDIGKVVVRTHLSSLISGNVSPSKIYLKDGSFEFNDLKGVISKFFLNSNSSSAIPALELKNISITFEDEDSLFEDIKGINGRLTYSGVTGQSLYFDGSFAVERLPYSITATLDDMNDEDVSGNLKMNLSNPYYKTSFEGSLKDFLKSPKFEGKASLVFGDINSDDQAKTSDFEVLAYQDDLKIESDIAFSSDSILAKNIVIKSNSITNASGDIEYKRADRELNASVSIDQVNLDQFLRVQGDIAENAMLRGLENVLRPVIDNFNTVVSLASAGAVKIKVNQVKYKKEDIKDFIFDSSVTNAQMLLNDLSFNVPGGGEFKSGGSVTNNDIRPKFNGYLNFNVANFSEFSKWLELDVSEEFAKNAGTFSFKSSVSLIPRNIKFDKIQASLGSMLSIGKVSIRNTGEKRLNTKVSLRFNEINSDDFNGYKSLDRFVTALYFYDKDKFGKLLGEYTNDYRWLRKFPMDINGEILVDKFLVRGANIDGVQAAFRIEPNNISFDRITTADNKIEMNTSASFDLTSFKPAFNIKSDIKRIDFGFISELFPSMEALKARLVAAVEKSEEIKASVAESSKEAAKATEDLRGKAPGTQEVVAENSPVKQYIDTFNFFSMQSFDSKFDINATEVTGLEMPVSSFKISGETSDGVLKVEKLSVGVFGGMFETTGSIVLTTAVPAVSFSYALNNFNPEKLLEYFFDHKSISGYMSVSGTVSGNGVNQKDLLNRVSGSINVVGKKIKWSGFDLPNIIKTVEYRMPYNEKLENLKIAIANGETEFEDLSGSILFSRSIASLENFQFANNRAVGVFVAKVDYYNKFINSISKLTFIPVNYSAPLTIELNSKGKISEQTFVANIDAVNKFLQTQTGDYNRFIEEEEKRKADSLIRNRRL